MLTFIRKALTNARTSHTDLPKICANRNTHVLMHQSRITLAGALIAPLVFLSGLHAAPASDQVTVRIDGTPGDAVFRSEVKVRDDNGSSRIQIGITNASASEARLKGWVVEFPWIGPQDSPDLVSTGGWDMGRSEARVWTPKEAGKVETGSYVLARQAGRYSLAGFTTWRVFNSKLRYDGGRLVVTGDGENKIVRPGETLALEVVRLATGDDWQDLLFDHAEAIARENRIRLNPPRKDVGWATWDYYGRSWSYDQVMSNMNKLLEIYPKADLLQIDGGWWSQRGDYTQVRENLEPDGMKRLGTLIRGRGLHAGIHLDGMRGDEKANVAKDHPDYFLKNAHGMMLVQSALNVGEKLDYTFFDFSNPAACDYFRNVLSTIRRDWGFDYFKIDFLRYGVNQFIQSSVGADTEIVPHDPSLTSFERIHRGLAAMREGMGRDAYFLGCSAVFGPTFGHVDGLRVGADINPSVKQYRKCALDALGNFYLHGKVVYNDADYLVVRAREDQDDTRVKAPNKDGRDLTLNEAELWTHFVALCGGPRLNSDNLIILREKRRALFRFAAEFPTAERYVPIDFWSHARDESDPPCILLTQARGDVYLGVFNWSDEAASFVIDGFSPSNLESLAKVSGAGEHESSGDSVTIRLPARHSTIFKLAGGSFDHLRKALSLKSPKS